MKRWIFVLQLFLVSTSFCSIISDLDSQSNEISLIPDKVNGHEYSDYSYFIQNVQQDPDYGLQTPEIIKSRGFKEETHYVTTLDGYILSLHRIVNQKVSGDDAKGPIILNHGLGGSSVDFVINSPGGHINEDLDFVGNNLGFELAKRGYDVWLANSRGNLYSTNHTKIDPKDREFWNFSWQEMIDYDVPGTIAYVRAKTNSSTVGWIGHSQGTLIMFGLLSERPEYADVVKPFIALAPVASIGYITSPIRYLAQDFLLKIVEMKGGEFLPDGIVRRVFGRVCDLGLINIPEACKSLAFLLAGGMDHSQINATRFPIYLRDESYGTSSKNIVHFGQNVMHKRFAKYNYGEKGNVEKYGVPQSPDYILERITSTNLIFMSGLADAFSDQVDMKILRKRLKGKKKLDSELDMIELKLKRLERNTSDEKPSKIRLFVSVPIAEDYIVPDKGWGHLEFIWGKDAGRYVNEPIIKYLEKYM